MKRRGDGLSGDFRAIRGLNMFAQPKAAVIFKVLETFYAWQAAKGQLAAATSALEATKKLAASAGAKAEQGLLTQPLLLQARQAEAEADYALQTKRAAAEVAWVDVAEAVGIPPGMAVKVASADDPETGKGTPKAA